MPELPDVEYFRHYFNATSLHQCIAGTHVQSPSLLVKTSPQGLGRALKHNRFESTQRHGKYLFAELSSGKWLVLHFGMSGRLDYGKRSGEPPEYTQLAVEFENGYQLDYVAPRKLGRIALSDSPEAWVRQQDLGPDALAISEDEFVRMGNERHGRIKSWLMDQHSIAGIGNEYSDEILFQCGIHPKRELDALDRKGLERLHKNLRSILQTAIEKKADPEELPPSFLLPHRKQGGHCPGCDTQLKTVEVSGRTAWFCPQCQGR
ncbi:Fpg/Nei family DNA glycosylase [Microbulbifer marinus]|uniref:Formamidopyrimidine-DNA glycosylase n=1 Tax=Microbulbifer marinus TaxID=658218 RepID=A0A1H3VKH5_9GAMM|nr:DNA-formamidopyrimidine glycosylase family protein [Microbulbifer marinus]SDZ75277.1 formamidopyrimidine-DNA glycosylase [Microbulbifer marinus]